MERKVYWTENSTFQVTVKNIIFYIKCQKKNHRVFHIVWNKKTIIPQKRIFQKIQWLINYVHMQKYYSLPDTFMFFLQAIKWFTTIILYISIKKILQMYPLQIFQEFMGVCRWSPPSSPIP